MGYKMKGFSGFGNSPLKGKGDNLKRIMSENKAAQKKAGTWYKKDPMPKDFNVKGSRTSTTPRYNPNMPKDFNVKGSGRAGNIWQKGKDLVKKVSKGASRSNVLALVLGATKTATADQPKFPKESIHYQDPKKKIKFGE